MNFNSLALILGLVIFLSSTFTILKKHKLIQSAKTEDTTAGTERLNRGEIVRTILAVIGITGIAIGGAICPGLLKITTLLLRRPLSRCSLRYAVHSLDKKGLIIAIKKGNEWNIRLSKRGFLEWQAYEVGAKFMNKPKHWDKKWRLLIFDIPESRRHVRDRIRALLRQFGFCCLQDSVWVYPYECHDILELLRTRFHVRFEALYVRAEFLESDYWLRVHFGLVKTKKSKKELKN